MKTNESHESIGRWSLDTFGPGDDPKVLTRRILAETLEACFAGGMSLSEVMDMAGAANLKARGEYGLNAIDFDGDPARVTIHRAITPQMAGAIPGELADVYVTVATAAMRLGIDLQAEVDRKMAINRGRSWKCFGDGTGQHLKAPQP